MPTVGCMDRDTARDHLQSAQRARTAAENPPVFGWTPPLAGIAITLGFLALGLLPFTIWWRLAALVIALAVWGAAGWLVLHLRARRGIRGIRGRTQTTTVVLLVCAVSLIPAVLGANPGMRWPYVIIGAGGGLAMWIAVRRQVDGA